MAKSNYQKHLLPFQFVALPKEVICTSEWQALQHSARALVIDLMSQYTGKNNGRLCPSFVVMAQCGWKSKETLAAAKRALLECSFAVCTRKGHPPRTAEWIGFTWWNINYEQSMDINPSGFPYLNFLKLERIDPNEGRKQAKKLIPVLRKSYSPHENRESGGSKSVPIGSMA